MIQMVSSRSTTHIIFMLNTVSGSVEVERSLRQLLLLALSSIFDHLFSNPKRFSHHANDRPIPNCCGQSTLAPCYIKVSLWRTLSTFRRAYFLTFRRFLLFLTLSQRSLYLGKPSLGDRSDRGLRRWNRESPYLLRLFSAFWLTFSFLSFLFCFLFSFFFLQQFSGSTVIDFNNTSGFFNDTAPEERIVAIYTLYNGTNQFQSQDIAYSLDGGYNFTKYELNPVLVSNVSDTQFRDPNVFWDTISEAWVMTVALPQQFKIQFYTSPDLKSWTLLSEFSRYGILGYQYEWWVFERLHSS